jgi:hypothetical protein
MMMVMGQGGVVRMKARILPAPPGEIWRVTFFTINETPEAVFNHDFASSQRQRIDIDRPAQHRRRG